MRLSVPGFVRRRWRQDRVPLLLYIITFIVMTYPFVFRMHDSLPLHNRDTFEILAKGWSLREALLHGRNLDHSQLLFYPDGLDITLQPQRWTAFPLWTALYTVVGDPLAYNLVSLFGILLKAYGMYLLGLRLFRRRIPAWVCGAFYSLSAPGLAMALRNPDTGATEWIPWLILALMDGLDRARSEQDSGKSNIVMALAGLCFAANVYMHLRIGIFAMLLAGGYIVWRLIAGRLWAQRRFWLAMATFALTAFAASSPLLFRTLSSDLYGFAIDRSVITAAHGNVDLLNYISADRDWPANFRQIIASFSGDQLDFSCPCSGVSHVGVVAIAFAVMGAVYILRFRREEAVWIILSILAFLLSLGVVIYVNGEALNIYWTPYRLLKDNFFFRALWHPFRMIHVFLFPISILVGYGLHARLRTVQPGRRGSIALAASIVMLLYGTSLAPIDMCLYPRPAYISALANLPEGAVIDLPMGSTPSTYYMTLQRLHGRPIVEGMLPRTPRQAYDYIGSNAVLRLFRSSTSSTNRRLESVEESEWREALRYLLRDGFRYLILHREVLLSSSNVLSLPGRFTDTGVFVFPTPVYQDNDNSIIDLAEWDGPFPVSAAGAYTTYPNTGDLNISVGDSFKLHSWSILDSSDPAPCKKVTVESWWKLVGENPGHNALELILAEEDGDGQIAISKQLPASLHTSEWQMGYAYRDVSQLEIPCDISGGRYILLLGLINSVTWESNQFRYPDGSAIGTHYYLTTLNVQAD
ncbi:MAG: hypothetical protein OXI30_19710 [Chloroflexota bacterium]|nr:hypothetical protein [Chloroflexota bacterium]